MLCLIGTSKKYPIKILDGLILGGYIYRYTPPPSRYAPVVTITNATSVCYTVAAVTATGDTDATATSSPAGVNTDYLISMQPQAADVQ